MSLASSRLETSRDVATNFLAETPWRQDIGVHTESRLSALAYSRFPPTITLPSAQLFVTSLYDRVTLRVHEYHI